MRSRGSQPTEPVVAEAESGTVIPVEFVQAGSWLPFGPYTRWVPPSATSGPYRPVAFIHAGSWLPFGPCAPRLSSGKRTLIVPSTATVVAEALRAAALMERPSRIT